MAIEDEQSDVMEQHEQVLAKYPDANYDTFWFYINQFHELYENDDVSISDLRATLELAKSELDEIAD